MTREGMPKSSRLSPKPRLFDQGSKSFLVGINATTQGGSTHRDVPSAIYSLQALSFH